MSRNVTVKCIIF